MKFAFFRRLFSSDVTAQELSKFKADTFDMIQNAFGENIMDKATVYVWIKREKV